MRRPRPGGADRLARPVNENDRFLLWHTHLTVLDGGETIKTCTFSDCHNVCLLAEI